MLCDCRFLLRFVSLAVCLSRGFSDNFASLPRKKVRKITSEVTVSANILAILDNAGLEKENLPRRIVILARSRITFAGFLRRVAFLKGINSCASNRCNVYRFYGTEFGHKFS